MLRREPVAVLAPLVLLAGCGGPAAPPAPPALAYDAVPPTPVVVYLLGDTSRIQVDAGGQTMEASVSTGATLDVEFSAPDGGLRVSSSFRDFSARATAPMAPTQTATTDAIDGPLVFSLDRRGEVTVVSSPEVDPEAARFLSPETTAATLFPRLPGRAVELGDTWTDTVAVDATQPGTSVTGASIVTYTVAGDTLVAGHRLLKVTLVAADHRVVTGTQQGMEINQSLDGSSEGWFLWDTARGLLQESIYDSDLTGTMEVDVAPFPMSIRVRSRRDVRLAGGPSGG